MARPKTTHCKRGHPRVPDQKSCVACRRLRERSKYEQNEGFREHKKAYQVRWRRKFFEANGFWHSDLFERKPKSEPQASQLYPS